MSGVTVRVVKGDGATREAALARTSGTTVRRISALEIEAQSRADAILVEARRRADDLLVERRLAELAFDGRARVAERRRMIEAVRVVSERVIGEALRVDDAVLERWLTDALATVARDGTPRWIEIRANAAVIARLEKSWSIGASVRAVVDANLDDTEVALSTNAGDAVVSVRWQVASLVDRLAPALATERARDE